MKTTRRRRGTGSIRKEGRGWSLRIGRKAGTTRYVSGFESQEAAEEASRAIAGQRTIARLIQAASEPLSSADPFAWAEARWSNMNPRERQAVAFARFAGRCTYCARVVTIPVRREIGRGDRAVLDHRIPVAGGGSDTFANVALSCHDCNARKADGAVL